MTRYVSLRTPEGPRFARVEGDRAQLLTGPPWLDAAQTEQRFRLDPSRLLCPVQPSKIIGVGRNFAAHARELDNEIPEWPLFFLKPPSSLLGPGGVLALPSESERVDYEAELAIVIGRGGRRIAVGEALEHVFGFSLACDVTARDLQKRDKQWVRAKGFDGFCPVGPWIVAGPVPTALKFRLFVNDQLRQAGSSRQMLFSVPELIAHASSFMTLQPGDLILTGTPPGVGPLQSSDRVRIESPDVGQLNFSVA